MGDHTAFFYGTLMAPQVLYRVCYGTTSPTDFQKSLLTIKPAILRGFQRHKVLGCDYPAIMSSSATTNPAPSSSVRGTYVSGLTDGDIWRLDIFEGQEYSRQKVKVELLKEAGDTGSEVDTEGSEVQVETYVWNSGEHKLEKGEWDFREFVKEKIGRWIGVEGELEYGEVDDAVIAARTDPTGGRGMGGSITDKLKEDKEIIRGAV